jgi:hypothetical protein
MKTKLVSLRALEREWKKLVDWDIDPANIWAYGTSATKLIIQPDQFRSKIALLDIENYQADLAPNFAYAAQVAYNIRPQKPCQIKQVSQWTQKALDGCELEINLKCPRCHKGECECGGEVMEIPVDEMYRQANPQTLSYLKHYYRHGGITDYGTSCFYHPEFVLMRPKAGHFHNLDYHIKDCVNRNTQCEMAYEIVDGEKIRVNFPTGQILISYLEYPSDEEGLIMIPDVEEVWEALVYYIAEREAFSVYYTDPQLKFRQRWEAMVQMRATKIGAARMRLKIPDPDEWDKITTNHWYKVVPYYNAFENSNKFQNDTFHYPTK